MKRTLILLMVMAACLSAQMANLSLARTAMNKGELVNAEQILVAAIDEGQSKFGQNSTRLDPVLEMLSEVYQREKRYGDAVAVQQQRLEIWTEAAGQNAVVVGRVLGQLSSAERVAGNLPGAEADSRRALAIMTAAFIDKPPAAQAAVDLADVLVAENRPDEAEQMLAVAEKTFETSVGPASLLTAGITIRRNALLKQLGRPPQSAQVAQANAFRPGGTGQNRVAQPHLESKTEPQYSEEARKNKLEGSILLSAVIDANGTPTQIAVLRPLGMGLDEKAIEAISQWKFTPGKKNGVAVPVFSQIEVNFRLL